MSEASTRDEGRTRPAPPPPPDRAREGRSDQRPARTDERSTSRPSGRFAGARTARLTLARIDPWSAMRLSFLLSIAAGIMLVVAVATVWFVLDQMYVFAELEELLATIGSASFLELMQLLEFDRVMSLAAIVAVLDVLLLTVLGALAAFLYNLVAALVGGLTVTFSDD